MFSELSRFHGIHPHRYTRSYLPPCMLKEPLQPVGHSVNLHKSTPCLRTPSVSFRGIICRTPFAISSKVLQSTPKYSTRDEHATNRDMILRDLRGDLHVIHILCTYCTWYWYNSATVPVGAKKCLDSPRPPRLSRRLRTLSWPETVNFIDKHLVKISKDSSIHEYHELFWRLNMFK